LEDDSLQGLSGWLSLVSSFISSPFQILIPWDEVVRCKLRLSRFC
jgi:hypothetical protein